jgi:hypothetical protein
VKSEGEFSFSTRPVLFRSVTGFIPEAVRKKKVSFRSIKALL